MASFADRLKNLKRQQFLLYAFVLALAVAIMWLVGSLVSSQRNTGIGAQLRELAEPLNPNIDLTVIERLENKRQIPESELSGFPIYKIIESGDGANQRVVTIDVDDDILATPAPTPIPETPPDNQIIPAENTLPTEVGTNSGQLN